MSLDYDTLPHYESWVSTMISPHVQGQDMMGWALLGLGAEAGECQGLAEKALRKNQAILPQKMISELGDVLFYWMAVHIAADLDPLDTIKFNIDKLSTREKEGTLFDSDKASDKH